MIQVAGLALPFFGLIFLGFLAGSVAALHLWLLIDRRWPGPMQAKRRVVRRLIAGTGLVRAAKA